MRCLVALALFIVTVGVVPAEANAWYYNAKSDVITPVTKSIFPLKGVNQAGLEFIEYIHVPDEESVDYFSDKGAKVIRVPFKWLRLQPTLDGALDETYAGQIDSVVGFATENGMYSIIDMHSYGKHDGIPIYDEGGPTEAQFADAWSRIATRYKDNHLVMFDLMNEPHTLTAVEMGTAAQAAITAIRASGSSNWIHVEGGGSYASCSAFVSSGWGDVAVTLTDPLDKLIFQCHAYFDDNNSGTSETAKAGSALTRLQPATTFARANGLKLFLGEFGFAANEGMYTEARAAMQHMQDNKLVWAGWTAWAAGPAWGGYMYSLEPTFDPLVEKPQMVILEEWL